MTEEKEYITVCHTSDTHNLFGMLKVKDQLPFADILIISGDFTENGKVTETEQFLKDIENIKDQFKKIIVIFGNHENRMFSSQPKQTIPLLKSNPNIIFLEDEPIELFGLNIYCLGWNTWHRNPTDHIPFSNLEKYFHQKGKIDILVTHEPPLGILGGTSMALLKVIQEIQPRFHLFGHMHESYGTLEKKYSKNNVFFSNAACKNDQDKTTRPARLIKIEK